MIKKNNAVLITAGTKRIGYHLSKKSLSLGLDVIAHYRSSRGTLARWLSRHPEFRGNVHFLQADLTDSPETLFEKISSLPVTLIGLVNNASIFSKGNLSDPDHFRRMLEIHLIVPLYLGKSFSSNGRNGWIINITDAVINKPNSNFQNYRISKLFLEELTRQQAFLYAPDIRVNAIAPGAMLPSHFNGSSALKSLEKKIPLHKTGNITSLLEAFSFLVYNTSCTGQIIAVDGGWHLIS